MGKARGSWRSWPLRDRPTLCFRLNCSSRRTARGGLTGQTDAVFQTSAGVVSWQQPKARLSKAWRDYSSVDSA